MELLLQRETFTDQSTTGELYVDGQQFCYTLELPNRDGLPGSCIPQGAYPVTISFSPRFGRNMPHVDDIPNRSEILIHWGNTAEDTDGCILVGQTRSESFVGESRLAFDALWQRIIAGENITLTVLGGAQVPMQGTENAT